MKLKLNASPRGTEPLQGLIRRLERSRGRLRRRLFLHGLCWSAVVALTIFALLGLVRSMRATPFSIIAGTFDLNVSWWICVITFLLGGLWTLGYIYWRTPGLIDLARRADAHFNLQERASAAFEVHARGARSTVDEALLVDAAQRTEAVKPQELIPVTFPRSAWYLLALVGLTLALQFLFPSSLSTESTAAPTEVTSFEDEELEQTGAKVRRVAELVTRDAEVKHDPYLRAVARAFDDLGTKIERGELDQMEVEQELSRLLGHLGRALGVGADNTATVDLLSHFSAPLLDDPASIPETNTVETDIVHEVGKESSSRISEARSRARQNPEASIDSEPEGQGTTDALNELLTQLEAHFQPPERKMIGDPQNSTNSTLRNTYVNVDEALLARMTRKRGSINQEGVAGQATGVPVGAAEDAGREAGDLAGEGVQPLAGVDTDTDSGQAAFGFEGVQLPAAKRESGRRITIEIPPEATFSSVSVAPGDEGGSWRRYNEVPVSGNVISTRHRKVVSRYFMPREATTAEAQP